MPIRIKLPSLASLASVLLIAVGGEPSPDPRKPSSHAGSEEEGCALMGSSWGSVVGGTSACEFWRVVGDIGTESEGKNNM